MTCNTDNFGSRLGSYKINKIMSASEVKYYTYILIKVKIIAVRRINSRTSRDSGKFNEVGDGGKRVRLTSKGR